MLEGNPAEDESQNTFLAQDLGLFFRVFTWNIGENMQLYSLVVYNATSDDPCNLLHFQSYEEVSEGSSATMI
jgi:hypothetical protein